MCYPARIPACYMWTDYQDERRLPRLFAPATLS